MNDNYETEFNELVAGINELAAEMARALGATISLSNALNWIKSLPTIGARPVIILLTAVYVLLVLFVGLV